MRRIVLFSIMLLLVAAGATYAQDNEFVGTKRCAMCHKAEKGNMIFEKWQEGPHAKAFATLASEEAAKVYADLGKSGNPQEDADCLKCHTTGHGMDAALTAKISPEDGVSCEQCHGAGGAYWKKNIMEDRDASIANGMVADPGANCTSCHNEESPTYKAFNFEEFWPQIEHSSAAGE
ncbi:cytochrome c family protein [bacterium]|nr:cytochrome c family protein [bacterium]